MRDRTILVIIIVILAAYFMYTKDKKVGSQGYEVPSEYKGSEGLDYIRKNYASELAQARSLCTNQFNGDWIDISNKIGCYNMKGFSLGYCNTEIINNLAELCRSIEGSSICSSTEASCTV